MREINLEDTIYVDFTTKTAADVPTTLLGSPVLSVLEENNATPITSGVSVSVDRASVTGLNMATVMATAANGYELGKTYSLYVSTGTVDSVSWIGVIVGRFVIVAPLTADILADDRTWMVGSEGNTSEQIVKLNTWSSGVRSVSFDLTKALSPGTTISTFSTATITKLSDSSSVTTSNLVIRQDKLAVNFDCAAISSAATYEAAVQVVATDGITINISGPLYVE